MPHDTIIARLFARARSMPNEPAYYEKQDGLWCGTSWSSYAEQTHRAARALLALGCEPGSKICILGFNRAEWVVMDLAAMCIGGAPAGIYTTCSPTEVQYIVNHAEAPVVLVENDAQLQKILKERDRLPLLKRVVLMRGAEPSDPLAMSWDAFMALGDSVPRSRVDELIEALEPAGLATLIYTSGTTGPPKGVMLSHDNVAWTAAKARDLISAGPADCVLSYLPLSHIAEQMFSLHGPITIGMPIYFAESIDKVVDNLKEVRPTVVFGVPRIWEKIHSGLLGKLGEAKGAKKRLVDWARGVGRETARYKLTGKPLPTALQIQYALANKLIYSKVKPAIGLDRGRICISGAAPIAKEVLEFLAELDIYIHEVYGQSEDTGPTSFNLPGRTKFGTVGTPIEDTQVRIADDGEIQVKGRHVFMGYFKDDAATAEVLIDGWLCSGDLGSFDSQGYLTITGRKKEILITAGGKNIAPKNIEAALKNHPLINEAVVIGDRRKYLTALVTLDPEALPKFAADKGFSLEQAPTHPVLAAEVQRAVDAANAELARVEQIKKFTVLPRNFTIADGELTPTLKIKRKVINEHFSREIEAMYPAEG